MSKSCIYKGIQKFRTFQPKFFTNKSSCVLQMFFLEKKIRLFHFNPIQFARLSKKTQSFTKIGRTPVALIVMRLSTILSNSSLITVSIERAGLMNIRIQLSMTIVEISYLII